MAWGVQSRNVAKRSRDTSIARVEGNNAASVDSANRVVEQDADQEFVEFLARLLEQH
jgi:hypothetical protein